MPRSAYAFMRAQSSEVINDCMDAGGRVEYGTETESEARIKAIRECQELIFQTESSKQR